MKRINLFGIILVLLIGLSMTGGWLLYRLSSYTNDSVDNGEYPAIGTGADDPALTSPRREGDIEGDGGIEIDGDPYDWTSDDLVASDTTGETSATAKDLISLCSRWQDGSLFLRVDTENQWVPLDKGWQKPLFTYLNEVNLRILVSFEGTDSTYRNLPGIGTEGVNLWTPWITASEPYISTGQGWDYCIKLDFSRDEFEIITPSTLDNPAELSDDDFATNVLQGMIELKFTPDYRFRDKGFHIVAYTIDESTAPWSPADICPNGYGGNTHDYDDDGIIDAYGGTEIKVYPAKLSIVWHANQALGRNTIEGKSIVDTEIDGKRTGFVRVIGAHTEYNAPVDLHWSGTLLTGLQWYTPDFLGVIRDSIQSGTVEIMTSTFGQSIMPWLPEDLNVYSINLESDLIERLFGVRPRIGWVPERCWKQYIFDDLVQAGIEAVVLDPQEIESYLGYDAPEDVLYATPTQEYLLTNGSGRLYGGEDDPHGFPSDIEPGRLKIFIINNEIQGIFWDTCVSNNYNAFINLKAKLAYYSSINDPNKILVCGSDMEIPGGHPYGWSWDGNIGDRYETMIKVLAGAPYVSLVHLSDNLDLDVYDVIAPGFENSSVPDRFSSYGQPQDYWFYERFMKETPNRTSYVFRDSTTAVSTADYPEVPKPIKSRADTRTYYEIFNDAYNALRNVAENTPPGKDSAIRLLRLANITLCTLLYETAWNDNYPDPVNGTGDWLASWGKDLWAHIHLVEMLARIANWSLYPPPVAVVDETDIDGDSYDEYVIKTPDIFIVIEPAGGRIVLIATIDGRVLMGNPGANWQIHKADSGTNDPGAVEDYFNPLTLNDRDIREYFEAYDVASSLLDFYIQGADGGYPLNNGTGGFYYAVPYSLQWSSSDGVLRVSLASQDHNATEGDEQNTLTKILEIKENSNTIKVQYNIPDADYAETYIAFGPDLLDLYENGGKYVHPIAFDTANYSLRAYINTNTGAFVGIGWNSDSEIDDLTPGDTPIRVSFATSYDHPLIPPDSGSPADISNPTYDYGNDTVIYYPNYGDKKPLAYESGLKIKDGATLFIYTAIPDTVQIPRIEREIPPLTYSRLRELIDEGIADADALLENLTHTYDGAAENISHENITLINAIGRIIDFAGASLEKVVEDDFITYDYGLRALAALNSIEWLISPPWTCQGFRSDVDSDGIYEYIIQNSKIRAVIDGQTAALSQIITADGYVPVYGIPLNDYPIAPETVPPKTLPEGGINAEMAAFMGDLIDLSRRRVEANLPIRIIRPDEGSSRPLDPSVTLPADIALPDESTAGGSISPKFNVEYSDATLAITYSLSVNSSLLEIIQETPNYVYFIESANFAPITDASENDGNPADAVCNPIVLNGSSYDRALGISHGTDGFGVFLLYESDSTLLIDTSPYGGGLLTAFKFTGTLKTAVYTVEGGLESLVNEFSAADTEDKCGESCYIAPLVLLAIAGLGILIDALYRFEILPPKLAGTWMRWIYPKKYARISNLSARKAMDQREIAAIIAQKLLTLNFSHKEIMELVERFNAASLKERYSMLDSWGFDEAFKLRILNLGLK